jgi:hypothetical protein
MLSVVHFRSDFKTNEKKIMKELDFLASSTGKNGGKAADLGGAMEGTEEIRQWVSLRDFLLCHVISTQIWHKSLKQRFWLV